VHDDGRHPATSYGSPSDPRDWRFYLEKHAAMSRDEYFAAPPAHQVSMSSLSATDALAVAESDQHALAGQ
jgi:hypothetical protein